MIDRRNFFARLVAAQAVIQAGLIVPLLDAIGERITLDDRRLVLPDTNRFRYLSDGD